MRAFGIDLDEVHGDSSEEGDGDTENEPIEWVTETLSWWNEYVCSFLCLFSTQYCNRKIFGPQSAVETGRAVRGSTLDKLLAKRKAQRLKSASANITASTNNRKNAAATATTQALAQRTKENGRNERKNPDAAESDSSGDDDEKSNSSSGSSSVEG